MRILLIDPDSTSLKSLDLLLNHAGFKTDATNDPEDGIDQAKIYDYDLVICENIPMIPRELRIAKVHTPIFVLTADHDRHYDNLIKAFASGVDDYQLKPQPRELIIARANALIRRSRGVSTPTIDFGPYTLDLDAKTVMEEGKMVYMTGKEYQMIELLALRMGHTLTKEMFLSHLYGGIDEPELKIIDVFICKLRKKVPHAKIETVWGRGYTLRKNGNEPHEPTLPEEENMAARLERQNPLDLRAFKDMPRELRNLWSRVRLDIIEAPSNPDAQKATQDRIAQIGFHGMYILNELFNMEKGVEELEEELEIPSRSYKAIVKTLLLILADNSRGAEEQDQTKRRSLGV